MNNTDWGAVETVVWDREVEDGRIWLPDSITDGAGHAAAMALRRIRMTRRELPEGERGMVELFLATRTGALEHWDLVSEMGHARRDGIDLRVYAAYRAISAGLNILVAGSFRSAHVNTEFGFHGNGSPKADSKDRAKAMHYATNTTPDFDFWLEKAKSGEVYTFGAERALELGVIHEVDDGPELWSCREIY